MADARQPGWTQRRWEGFFIGVAAGITATVLAFVAVLTIDWVAGSNQTQAAAETVTTVVAGPPGGEDLAVLNGCTACHSADGSVLVGPSWLGIAGSERPIEGGGTVLADSAYLDESIVDPSVIIVAGFADLMPKHFGDTLTGVQIDSLVEYIESIG